MSPTLNELRIPILLAVCLGVVSADTGAKNGPNITNDHGACGGFLKVSGEEFHLEYKVPPELLGKNSLCVWVVAADRGNIDTIKILDNPVAQMNFSTSRISILSNFTINGANFAKLSKFNKEQMIGAPFLVLYFRTTSTAPDSGFHLKIRGSQIPGNKTGEDAQSVKHLSLTADPTATMPLEFQYPPKPRTHYANNERTFVIVKPREAGSRLKLDLKSVDTQADHDWLQIIRVNPDRDTPSQLAFDNQSNWISKLYEAEPDDPFILYFHSDNSTTRTGFRFSYEEKVKYEEPTSTCGGHIKFSGEFNLVYKVPPERLGQNLVCVWIVGTERGGFIKTEIVDNLLAQFDPSNSSLTALLHFSLFKSHNLKLTVLNRNYFFGIPFFALHFRTNSSAPNAGFHLRLREPEVYGNTIVRPVKYVARTVDPAFSKQVEFQYPEPPQAEYGNNERTFIVVKPGVPGARLRLHLKSVSTEANHDGVAIASLGTSGATTIWASGDKWDRPFLDTTEDEPTIIYFHSDESITNTGFKIFLEQVIENSLSNTTTISK